MNELQEIHGIIEDETGPHPDWLPIKTLPPPVQSRCMVVLLWWEDDFHLAMPRDGKWALYCDRDVFPFKSRQKPQYWCPIPFMPVKSVVKMLRKSSSN